MSCCAGGSSRALQHSLTYFPWRYSRTSRSGSAGFLFSLPRTHSFFKTASGITAGSPPCHHLEALAVPSLTSSQSCCL